MSMNVPDILAATTPVVDALEQLEVPYHIGGSVASSLNGIPRLTIDVDIVTDLKLKHVRPLVKLLEADYYIDEDAVNQPKSKGRLMATCPCFSFLSYSPA